jgi:penicillin-binding protein 1A
MLLILILLASTGALGEMPDFKELEDPQRNLASIVYSSDGKVMGKYYVENRVAVEYEDISPNVINALIATEDVRFEKHSGIDGKRLVGAIMKGGRDGGASTITQQLAKLLFHKKPKNKFLRLVQKVKEWVIALQLERSYTKKEILTMYLNQADFGHNIYGINSASKIYFDKAPKDLTVPESALLVGLLKAPTKYSPITNLKKNKPEVTINRRNTVLNQMAKYGKISGADCEKFKKEPVIVSMEDLQKRISKNAYGHGDNAQYFMEELKKDVEAWCMNNVNPRTKKHYNLYTDGLRIYTTIDSRIQAYAEAAVNEYMPKLQALFFKTKKGKKNAPFASNMKPEEVEKIIMQGVKSSDGYKALKNEGVSEADIMKVFKTPKPMTVFAWNGLKDTVMTPWDSVVYHKSFLMNGLMCMDPHTGEIKAWSGGVNFEYFKYDHVRAGKYDKKSKTIVPGGGRQVGSTFKPFVYAMAMREGRSPCEEVPNVKVCIESAWSRWCPDNSGGPPEGAMISLKVALANSVNYISAYLMKQYGAPAVVKLVRELGVTAPLDPNPSICLGTPDISVFEMVGAFSTFFNKGIYNKPIFLTRIEDKNGNTLAEFTSESREVLNEESSFLMTELLKGVVLQGTAGRLRSTYKFKEPVAGKTGTTQSNSDGWFIGATPDLVCGVWTGADDRTVRFVSTGYGQGANMALPIWGLFMRKVYDDPTINLNRGDFDKPTTPPTIELNCGDYKKELNEDNSYNNIIFDND